MTQLEKEFFEAMKRRKYVEGIDGNSWDELKAKAATALCEKKMKEAFNKACEEIEEQFTQDAASFVGGEDGYEDIEDVEYPYLEIQDQIASVKNQNPYEHED